MNTIENIKNFEKEIIIIKKEFTDSPKAHNEIINHCNKRLSDFRAEIILKDFKTLNKELLKRSVTLKVSSKQSKLSEILPIC